MNSTVAFDQIEITVDIIFIAKHVVVLFVQKSVRQPNKSPCTHALSRVV